MSSPRNRVVVFAYHNVGVCGFEALLACGFDIQLVVTHQDSPTENIWFASVERLAQRNGIPVIKPDNPNDPEIVGKIRQLAPDWLFSFYYRHLLGAELLEIPSEGAFNLHGSLLPKYRGRVPVNWAIILGEKETGASLHRMVVKPDAGNLVDQQSVPILPNDTATDVFQKVTCAAEMVLMRTLPKMLDGSATEIPLRLDEGSYFGGRKPADGQIDWSQSALQIHNLIRAVAPPYPGAFFEFENSKLKFFGSYYQHDAAVGMEPRLYWEGDYLRVDCRDGHRLTITQAEWEEKPLTEQLFKQCFGEELRLIGSVNVHPAT
ncbi:formyltransferase [Microbulbifer hainanensis]|uniref:formyltransferase n=1 Tax=Microbulbifer hainanensis TaxID=2735675 RepID=UPI00186738CA|nr:formyltransferase [Microbulbifer hainanensis]